MRLTVVVLLLSSAALLGQTNQASISGVVSDQQSALIPGAKVIATNSATGLAGTAVSNAAGFYSIPDLPVGTYSLTVEHQGFRRYARQGITLSTGQTLGVDVKLDIGAVSETVNVSGDEPLVETRTSDIGQLIESKSIEDLPLGNRRTMNIINLTGASVFVTYPNVPANSSPSFTLAGGRTGSQMFWIDGGSGQNIRLGEAQINLDPPVETVGEIKVLSNNYSAQYGGSSGGVILETTKSGSNQVHGSAYEYLRNDAMDAPGFFAPVQNGSKQVPELRYNIFGTTAGGPVKHDKTFFFFAYEGERLETGNTTTITTPTVAQRGGDFSQTLNASGKLIPIYDPATTQVVNGVTTRTQFPGNVIPANRLDPVAMKLMPYYPLPNRAPTNIAGANNFSRNFVVNAHSDFIMGKVDHNLSQRDRLTGRYLWTSGSNPFNSAYPIPAADPKTHTENAQRFWYGDWTRVVSPATVNDLRFTYVYRKNNLLSNGVGGNYPSKLGLTGVDENAFPQFSPAGFSALGTSSQNRPQDPVDQYQWVDDVSHVRGRHAMKFGVEARRSRDHEVNLNTASGTFTFATTPTGLPGNASTGNGMASLLLGFPTAFNASQTLVLNRTSWYVVGFLQDDWTVSSSLTLNLGLRWELDTPIRDSANRINGFNAAQINPVSGTPGVVKFLGVNGYPTTAYDADWNNFGPRLGFAWKPFRDGRTVVRGGYGIFYTLPVDSAQPNAAALGFGPSVTLNSPDNGITAPFYLRNGVPGGMGVAPVLNDSFGAVPVGKNPNTAVTFFERSRGTGYSEQFNFGVQHELPSQMLVEVTVLGNLSRKLPDANMPINQIPPSILGPTHDTQAYRPFPQFSNVMIVAPTLGNSAYYAGMLRFQKRYSHGLNVGGSYTFSKYLANFNDPGAELGSNGGPYSNYYNRRADYGPEANDINHRFVFNAVYEIPFGQGREWLSSGLVGKIIGGWDLSNVTTVQTGPPITILAQTDTTNSFAAGSLRPNVLQNPNLASPSVKQWFNTAAFAQPAAFQFGNEGVGIVRAPGLVNLDFSLIREFRFTERVRFQLRGEAFNAFNHTNLSLPARTFGAAGFGTITASGPARQMEIGARMTF